MKLKTALVCGVATITPAIFPIACASNADRSLSERSTEIINRDQESEQKANPTVIQRPADDDDQGSLKITRRLLSNLLALIRQSRSIEDFTVENLSHHFGAEVIKTSEARYGLQQRLSDRWLVSYGVDKTSLHGPRFEMYFQDDPLSSVPPMTGICGMDFNEFNAHLEEMGFTRHRMWGSHGARGWDWYDDSQNKSFVVEVYTRGEANYPAHLITHDCIKNIIIK